MDKVNIWHNPRCSKSREGLKYLQDKGLQPEVYDYMPEGIDPKELAQLIEKRGQPVEDFIHRNEPAYTELGLQNKALTAEEFAHLAARHPRLLQRPRVIRGNDLVLGRPASKIDAIL